MLSACRAVASGLRNSRGAFPQAVKVDGAIRRAHAKIKKPNPLAMLMLGPTGNISPWLLGQRVSMATAGDEADSHDDFKPQVKAEKTTESLHDHIERDIKDNSVMVYMKGVPDAPQCGFSAMVVRILNEYDVSYSSRNVLADPELRVGIKQFSHWPTIPQVFINGEFVGGSDILINMHRTGELEKLLEQSRQQTAGKGD